MEATDILVAAMAIPSEAMAVLMEAMAVLMEAMAVIVESMAALMEAMAVLVEAMAVLVSASGEGPFCPKEAGCQIALNGHGLVEVAQVDHKIQAGLVGPKAQVTGCPVVQPDVPVQRLPFSVHSLTEGALLLLHLLKDGVCHRRSG